MVLDECRQKGSDQNRRGRVCSKSTDESKAGEVKIETIRRLRVVARALPAGQ